ncbi:MAG: response regulator [Fibrobacteres bacterium]|nr:response regulator [Fibrobacterota bacterium]
MSTTLTTTQLISRKPTAEPVRRNVVYACLIIGIMITSGYGIYSATINDYLGFTLNIISAAGLLIGIAAMLKKKWNSLTGFISVLPSLPLFLFDVAMGSPVRYDLLWSFIVPVFAMPLIGRKAGLILAVCHLIASAVILFFFSNAFATAFVVTFISIYIVITLSFWLYETFRVQALERQAEGERNFREFVDNLPQIVFEFDDKGNFTYVNEPALQAFGYTRADLEKGLNVAHMFPLESREIAINSILKRTKGGVLDSHEYTAIKKDGTLFPVLIHSNPIFRHGRGIGLRGIVVDISDLKKTQAEKEELSSQLHQLEKMDAVGKLAGGVAHDFNNQLAGIVGYADLICAVAGPDRNDINEYSQRIKKIGNRAADLTQQLLAFARKGKYLTVEVDVKKLIYDTVYILERSIDKNIVIEQSIPDESLAVVGDPSQLQSMLLNLAINGRDAMPYGGKLILSAGNIIINEGAPIAIKHKANPGPYVLLSVADSGTGMSDETQRRMFEPFFTTKEPGKGTGIGLAAVYGTVMSHKGIIEFNSAPGKGTTFDIYLPQSPSVSENVKPAGEHAANIETNTACRVLVIDDEEPVRTMIHELLRVMNFTVHTEAEGVSALDWYQNNQHETDIVLLDMIMPGMSGRDVWVKMKKINPGVKVLLISGYSLQGDAQNMIDDGVHGFLQKPFDAVSLKSAIEKVCAKR